LVPIQIGSEPVAVVLVEAVVRREPEEAGPILQDRADQALRQPLLHRQVLEPDLPGLNRLRRHGGSGAGDGSDSEQGDREGTRHGVK
jgi:hypothetical protein